ncbi:hypothetical protein N0V90_010047 [Kalmusia sp. IMI 367209]|nr:hypothetical protein N0V90_010047 [Kalmusia sp. IMI 367209]
MNPERNQLDASPTRDWRASLSHLQRELEDKERLEAKIIEAEEKRNAADKITKNLEVERAKIESQEQEIRTGFEKRIRELEESIKITEGNADAEMNKLKLELQNQQRHYNSLILEKAKIEQDYRVAKEEALAKYEKILKEFEERQLEGKQWSYTIHQTPASNSHQQLSGSTEETKVLHGVGRRQPQLISENTSTSHTSSVGSNAADDAKSQLDKRQPGQQATQDITSERVSPSDVNEKESRAQKIAKNTASPAVEVGNIPHPFTTRSKPTEKVSLWRFGETEHQATQTTSHMSPLAPGKNAEIHDSKKTDTYERRIDADRFQNSELQEGGLETKSKPKRVKADGARPPRIMSSLREPITTRKTQQVLSQPLQRVTEDQYKSLQQQLQENIRELDASRKTVQDLELKNAAAQEQFGSDEEEKQRLRQQLGKKIRELEVSYETVEDLERKNRTAQLRFDSEEIEKTKLRQQLQENAKELQRLHSSLNEKDTALAQSQKKTEDLELKNATEQERLEVEEDEKARLRQQLEEKSKELQRVQSSMDRNDIDLTDSRKNFEGRIATLNQKLVESHKTIEDLERKNATAQERLESEENEKARLRQQLEENAKELQRLQSSMNQNDSALAQSQKKIEGRMTTLSQELKEREESIETKSRTIQDLQAKFEEARRRLIATQEAYREEVHKSDRLSVECTRLANFEEQSKTLENEKTNLLREKNEKKAELQKLRKRATEEREESSRQKQALEGRIASIVEENLKARPLANRSKNEELEKLSLESKTQVSKLEFTIRDQAATIESMKAEIGRLPQLLEEINKSHELNCKEKEIELDKVKTECNKLEEKISDQMNKIEALEEDLEQSRKDVEQMKAALRNKQLEGITSLTFRDQISQLQAIVMDHENRETNMKKELNDLKFHLSKQESKVKEAQQAAFDFAVKREQLRYDFIADNTARAKLHRVLQYYPGEWAGKYATSSFQGGSAAYIPITSLKLWKRLIGEGRDPTSILPRYNPRIVLIALLVDFVVQNILSQPFIRLQVADETSTSGIFAAKTSNLYTKFLEVDQTDESERNKSTQNQILLQSAGGEEQFEFSLCDVMAKNFIEGPARILLDNEKNAEQRMEELAELIKQAVWVSTLLWKQRANLHFLYYDELKNMRYSDGLKEITLWEQISPEIIPQDGASLDMLLRPKIRASIAGDDEPGIDEPRDENSENEGSGNEEKIWGDPLLVWRNLGDQGGKAINAVYDSDEESDEGSGEETGNKSIYPDTDSE